VLLFQCILKLQSILNSILKVTKDIQEYPECYSKGVIKHCSRPTIQSVTVCVCVSVCLQLTDGLYAPNVEQEQLESVRTQVAELVGELMGALHHEHVQGNSEHMVSQSVKACPSLLTDKDRQLLNTLVVSDMGSEFDVAKKTVVHKVVSEIINPISASNLDLAATISEYLVDKTLAKLEKINSKLIKLQKALQKKTSSGATPDQKVSRAFTFRVEGEESQPKVKRRRPISTYSDSIDLPSGPLETEAPQLQHIVKSRPKPARLQKGGGANRRPHKPAHLAQAKDEVDIGDFVRAVKDAEQNSLRAAKEDEKKETRGTVPKTPLRLPADTKTKVAERETDAAAGKEPLSLSISPPPTSSSEEGEKEVDVNEEKEKEEEKGGGEEVVEETDEEGAKKEESAESEAESEVKEGAEPVGEDNDSEENEEEAGELVEEKPSSPDLASEKVTLKTTARSPPLTPPPSPPHDTLSPPLVTTPWRTIEDSTSTNDTAADESSSSLETPTAPKKEPSPSPSEEIVAKDRKKSRRETKKEEKERKEKEREERERSRREKEKEEREREKREKEEKERQRKEREREEREREKREKEEREKEKKAEKKKSTEDLLGVDSGRSPLEASPSRSIDKRKSKTVRENRKKSGLSKLFSRPKAKEEGDEGDGPTSDPEANAELHKSPRRQTTSPTKGSEEEREAEDRVGMTPELQKKAPPPVRKKPVKSKSVDFGMGKDEDGEEGGEGEKRRRPVGGVAAMPLPGLAPSQLTGVLKSRPSPQQRSKVSQLCQL
jgi:hypothetical protein